LRSLHRERGRDPVRGCKSIRQVHFVALARDIARDIEMFASILASLALFSGLHVAAVDESELTLTAAIFERLLDADAPLASGNYEFLDPNGGVVGVAAILRTETGYTVGPIALDRAVAAAEVLRFATVAQDPIQACQFALPLTAMVGQQGEALNLALGPFSMRRVEAPTTLLGRPAPGAMQLGSRHHRSIEAIGIGFADGDRSGWLASEDQRPLLDLLDVVAWLQLVDGRQMLLRTRSTGDAVAGADQTLSRAVDFLSRIGATDTRDWILSTVPRRERGPLSFALSPEWPARAWELRTALQTTALRHGELIERWLSVMASAHASRGLPPWLIDELQRRAEEASTTLPLGVVAGEKVWRELADRLADSIAAAAATDEQAGREEARTAVWECWGRLWNEPGCIDSADRSAADSQRSDIADRVASTIVGFAQTADEAGAAGERAALARAELVAQLEDPFAPWALLPFDERVLVRVSEILAESQSSLAGRWSSDSLENAAEISTESRFLVGQILAVLSVDFADSPKARARLVPFADAWPGVAWSGGPVRPRLSIH
jgi:hypothetical protein